MIENELKTDRKTFVIRMECTNESRQKLQLDIIIIDVKFVKNCNYRWAHLRQMCTWSQRFNYVSYFKRTVKIGEFQKNFMQNLFDIHTSYTIGELCTPKIIQFNVKNICEI